MPSNAAAEATGAAGGLGKAITHAVVRAGVPVSAVDIDEAGLKRLCGSLPAGTVYPVLADVAEPPDAERCLVQTAERLGPPLILVSNTGVTDQAAFLTELSDELWQAEPTVHATAAFTWARACLPRMQEAGRGRVISVSSIAASMRT